jgi:hypothetical protein
MYFFLIYTIVYIRIESVLDIIVGQQNIESLKKNWILVAPVVFASERISGFRAQIFPGSEGNKVFLSSNAKFLLDTGF